MLIGRIGYAAVLGLIALLSTVLWALIIRALGEPTRTLPKIAPTVEEPKP